jgi:hypothetical protein
VLLIIRWKGKASEFCTENSDGLATLYIMLGNLFFELRALSLLGKSA